MGCRCTRTKGTASDVRRQKRTTRRRRHRHLPSAPRWELGAFPYFKASVKTNFKKTSEPTQENPYKLTRRLSETKNANLQGDSRRTRIPQEHPQQQRLSNCTTGPVHNSCVSKRMSNNEPAHIQVDSRWQVSPRRCVWHEVITKFATCWERPKVCPQQQCRPAARSFEDYWVSTTSASAPRSADGAFEDFSPITKKCRVRLAVRR